MREEAESSGENVQPCAYDEGEGEADVDGDDCRGDGADDGGAAVDAPGPGDHGGVLVGELADAEGEHDAHDDAEDEGDGGGEDHAGREGPGDQGAEEGGEGEGGDEGEDGDCGAGGERDEAALELEAAGHAGAEGGADED